MDLITMLWLFPILFMLHNFEEIIMLQYWWRKNKTNPPHSPFTRLASYPQETTAALIAAIFFLFSLIIVLSIISHNLIFGIGLALAFGFQLVGHIVEFLRLRRYMPHIITAAITLPYYPLLFFKAVQEGFSPVSLLLATCGMGILGLLILWSSHMVNGTLSRWLKADIEKNRW